MSPSKQKAVAAKKKASAAGKRTKPTPKTKTGAAVRRTEKTSASKAPVPRSVRKSAPRAAAPRAPVDDNATVKMVRDLAAIVERRSLTELIVETEDATYTLRRGGSSGASVREAVPMAPYVAMNGVESLGRMPEPAPAAREAAAPEAASQSSTEEGANGEYHLVTSPFVGTFYRRPNPDADCYVEVGQRVEKGQVLCIIEAMKLMNEIEADVAGVIVTALVEDSDPVEYGQPLFKVSPL
jgi:acetyl-CoA carboxylase biotin carboxyl carrier protein